MSGHQIIATLISFLMLGAGSFIWALGLILLFRAVNGQQVFPS